MTKEETSVKVENEKQKQGRPERDRGRRGQKKEKQKPQTKIVIRHLPPTMSEEEFLQQIDPLPEHDFYYFAAADWSLGYDATCRAYITLKEHNDVYLFRDRFDGYVFVDSKGAEYPAIVEFAPFQGLVKNKSRRSDNKVNSIEEESHYQQFLAKLEEDREAAAKGGESKLEFSLVRKKEEKITSTPLLQYLANKKEKRREEAKKRTEEKRRQREEEKEKRRPSQQQVTKIISSQDGGCGNRRDSGSKSGAGASGKENVSNDKGEKQPQEERKNSRSKRRAERDQRRREEHEQRKRERERLEREQKEKGVSAKSEEKNGDTKSETSKNADLKTQQSLEKPSEDSNQRKDSTKKRSRNRRGYSYESNDNDKGKRCENSSAVSNLDDLKSELMKPAVSGNSNEVSETVVDFIRSVVTAKEFVPSKKQQQPADATTTVTEKESLTDEKATMEQLKKSHSLRVKDDEGKKENTRSEKSNARDESRQTRRERTAEERRIRNKDRPSIAIYQPKPRIRVSEERDTITGGGGAGKDACSNPGSDCESGKKDEQRYKKVSRYSERRLERKSANANRDKQQKASESDGGGGSGNDNHNNHNSEDNHHVEATANIGNDAETKQNDSEMEN